MSVFYFKTLITVFEEQMGFEGAVSRSEQQTAEDAKIVSASVCAGY